ncbi:MAG: tRNA (guanosine(37)-N1)-methyltransferase TrmD [Candidatus Omnitrophica bacterium]|nr:tRNA (guanosine(37)-N1)-methyltransferase TrmD [Candidatus Omnitrophota bacterium]
MKIDILTLFPEMFDSFFSHSMMKRAIKKGILRASARNLRDFTHDRHRTCDDKPFGGGPGMLMKPEPVFEAVEALLGKIPPRTRGRALTGRRFVYLTPQGEPFSQQKAKALSRSRHLVFLCGHYEGVDERVIRRLVTDEISIGDYVLTGGEVPAMVVIDAVVRLLKGVLGSEESKSFESFSHNLLEYPQYTRPASYRGMRVPEVLLSGNHQAIERWRRQEAAQRTLKRRPDILKKQESRSCTP